MEKAKIIVGKFCSVYATFLKYVISVLVPILILTVTYQIVARHVQFIPRLLWTEEVCRFALNWLVMLGAALAVRNNDHFDIDLMTKLSPRAQKIRYLIVNLIIFVAVLFFAAYGWEFALSGLRRRSLAAGLSMFWVYISFLFFGVSAIIFQGEKLLRYFTENNTRSKQA